MARDYVGVKIVAVMTTPRQDLTGKKLKKLKNLTTFLRLEPVLRSDLKPMCFGCKILKAPMTAGWLHNTRCTICVHTNKPIQSNQVISIAIEAGNSIHHECVCTHLLEITPSDVVLRRANSMGVRYTDREIVLTAGARTCVAVVHLVLCSLQ